MIVNNVLGQYTPESLAENLPALAAALLSVLLTLLLALPIGKALKLPGPRLGVFVVMFAFSNSVFIGVPVSTALFGEEAVGFALLYYIANTSIFWSVANSMIISDAKGKFDVIATIRTQPRAFLRACCRCR